MTFLQPFILFALPLIGLPILIHLVNQNRHRTVQWGATMFLIRARRMARGMARLRYWLIMLARMLAVAGLVFAISRPMAGGWLGLTAGGAPETTLILLDRSVSMEAHQGQTRLSRRTTALKKLSDLLANTGPNTQIVLFDSATEDHRLIASPEDLPDVPQTGPSDTAADIPGMLQRAAEYITTNETRRTDIWICSDLQKPDWDSAGGRWETIRRQLSQRDGVRVYLLAYPDQPDDNLSISVSGVHRRETQEGAELLMDIRVTRSGPAERPIDVPLNLVLDGARSTLTVSVSGAEFVRNGHAIAIDREATSGWGRIELPDDANTSDNVYRFTYAEAPIQRTVVVSESPATGEYLRLAAATPSDRSQMAEAVLVNPDQLDSIDWRQTAFVIWQAPIPEGAVARQLKSFIANGRSLLILPSQSPSGNTLFNCGWQEWQTAETLKKVGRWRTQTDLLANSRSGTPLPLGELDFFRHCELNFERASVLASLDGGEPLLVRTWSNAGAAWFFASSPGQDDSTLIDNGIVFYVLIQRALARGTAALGNARQIDCGTRDLATVGDWTPLDKPSRQVAASARTTSAGLYSDGDVRYALNRPLTEDTTVLADPELVDSLFEGIDFTRLDDSAGSTSALANEVWRLFLTVMIVALMAEALLSLPERRTQPTETAATAGLAASMTVKTETTTTNAS